MSALRSRVEISNDWRPHFMVLWALPETDVINTCFSRVLPVQM
jgi:hypothetical protein